MTNKLLKKLIIFAIFALFFIPANKVSAFQAELKMAYNDGAQCFLNGREFINTLSTAQTEKYWNKTLSIGDYLIPGQNVLACRVSNGDGNRGTLLGYFDVELIVDSLTIIPRGGGNWKYYGTGGSIYPPYVDSNNRSWYEASYNDNSWNTGYTPFDGRTSNILTRAPDNAWFRKYFNISSINCSNYVNQIDCLSRTGCYWTGSTCISNANLNCPSYTNRTNCLSVGNCLWTGFYCVESSLASCSSFNNQADCLTKTGCYWTGSYCASSSNYNCSYQNNRTACLSTSGCIWTGSYCTNTSSTTCSSFTTQIDCLNRVGCYWTGSYCTASQYLYDQEQYKIRNFSLDGCWQPTIHQFDKYKLLPKDIKEISIESARPLITGLVKYGNKVEVFVNNKSVGEAVVKEGEYSGVANFYFKPKENFIDLTKKLETHEIKFIATNPRDNSVCTTSPITFVVVPYPAPIIHRFGEIDYVQRANILTIRTRRPLITGLVKYGSIVEIYIDKKMVGRPRVKEGEMTGVANFYMILPELTFGQHTLYAIAKKAGQEDVESPSSQVYTFTIE